MKKSSQAYDYTTIAQIRNLVEKCSNWLEARDKISKYIGVHPDNVTRMNKKYSFWNPTQATESDDDLKPLFKPRKIRRLFLDIETSPNVVLSWRIGYNINLDHSNILKERSIICIGYKWEDEDHAYSLRWDKNHDDKEILKKILEIANEADEIIMHNGDKFDLPWIKTRCIYHGLQPLPEYKTIDTLQWARKKLLFNSNKLDYIANFLGFGGKIKTEFNLWKNIVLNDCEDSMNKMLEYCKKDVILLQKVWERLSKVVSHKTHVGVLNGGPKWACPHCGSTDVKLSKTRVTAKGAAQYQMVCKECGGYYTVSEIVYSQYLTANNLKTP